MRRLQRFIADRYRGIPPRLRIGILVFWATVTALGLSISNRPPLTKALDFLETFAYLAFLFLLAGSRDLRAVLGPLGPGLRVVALAFFGMLFTAQIAADNARTYPFVQWKMYTSLRPSTQYLEYEARFASGEVGHYPFRAVGANPSPRAFMSRFQPVFVDLEREPSPGTPPPDTARAVLEMRRLIHLYNSRGPEDPIVGMAVYRRAIPVRSYAGPESVTRRLLVSTGEME